MNTLTRVSLLLPKTKERAYPVVWDRKQLLSGACMDVEDTLVVIDETFYRRNSFERNAQRPVQTYSLGKWREI